MNPDPRSERDRTLRRVRGTTAVAGVGAVLATGALAGLLGHAATSVAVSTPTSTSTTSGATSSAGLSSPTASPTTDTSSGDEQPSVVTGGS